MADQDFIRLLHVFATKTCLHSNTIKARAERKAKIKHGSVEAKMAANLHTASLLLREAAERLEQKP